MRPPRFVTGLAWCVASVLVPAASAVADEAGAAAKPAGEGKLEPLPPAPLLLDKVIRGFIEAAPGRETLDDVMRRAAERHAGAVAAEQQRHMIRQQTQQLDGMLQPLLFVELAFVKRTCGSLSPEARKEVLAAARQATRSIAERLARLQIEGQTDDKPLDVRATLHEKVASALEPRAARDEFAAYEQESRLRQERRAEAARIRIVARLDAQLGLTSAQRRAVLDDLRAGWQGEWIRVLDFNDGLLVGGQPPAPDFAEASIVPHLDPLQADKWRQWSAVASWKSVPRQHIDWSELSVHHVQRANGDQKPDAWWQP